MRVALATTVHDPNGHLIGGVERTGALVRSVFPFVALNATTATQTRLLELAASHWGAAVETHEPGNVAGRARRDALRAALLSESDRVLYCDLDHLIRWLESSVDEVRGVAYHEEPLDFVIVGRTLSAFARSPARLRETESIVNRVYELTTGRAADVMFAIRVVSRAAGEAIVKECREDTMANDVEWPLFAEGIGLRVGFVAAEGLDYRTNPDFDEPSDGLDLDPVAWIDRAEIAVGHLRAMRPFIRPD